MVKPLPVLAVCLLLVLTFAQIGFCQSQTAAPNEWQIETRGGYYTETEGLFHLWSNGGIDAPGITFWREIQPDSDFSFSLQVNALKNESCAIFVRDTLGSDTLSGFNFEFGHYGENIFLLARNYTDWSTLQVSAGEINTWYTMQLNISKSPFLITASVFEENGTCIGSISTREIAYFDFEDINCIGFGVWGYSPSDYFFRNIECSLDSVASNTSNLSITTEASSTNAGATVTVYGSLSDAEGLPLQNKTIILYYNVQGVDYWIPISSTATNEAGKYSMQWINSASGAFTLKVEWSGDNTSKGASNSTTLSFLPSQNKAVLVFESNSTVSSLAFDNETATLSFNVTGPSGTNGYVKATIAKSILSNGDAIVATIDGKQLNYTVTSTDDSWVYCFNYSHSTHQISMQLNVAPSTQPLVNVTVLVAIVIVLGAALAATVYAFSRRDKS